MGGYSTSPKFLHTRKHAGIVGIHQRESTIYCKCIGGTVKSLHIIKIGAQIVKYPSPMNRYLTRLSLELKTGRSGSCEDNKQAPCKACKDPFCFKGFKRRPQMAE